MPVGSQMPDENTLVELARLRAEHRQISDLLTLIRELTSTVVRSESVGDLFCRGFETLFRCVPFDVGAAVLLEQNLELFLSARENAGSLVNDALMAKIRRTLEAQIPVSFASTEIIVHAEHQTLPPNPGGGAEFDASALLESEHRPAGLLLLTRNEPFSERDQQILVMFASQVSMLLDATRAREHILSLLETDDLTGMPNRRYFRRQMPQEIERARTFSVPLSLLMVDIDEFKQINDSFGHVIGDVVLSELCGAVRETLRPTDMLARLGGDEFTIILPHTDSEGACSVAARILARLGTLTIPTDEEGLIQCSVSIGVAQWERDESTDDLVRRADERLYQSKRAGKNRYTA